MRDYTRKFALICKRHFYVEFWLGKSKGKSELGKARHR
jgi:hypothetical protein